MVIRANRNELVQQILSKSKLKGKDLEALNIQFYETNQRALNEHGGYKIAVYNKGLDFHMKRQNCDGSWSEKMGYTFNFKQSDSIKETNPHAAK